jgi:RHS repeat-associated protein
MTIGVEGKLFQIGIQTLRGGGTDEYSVDSLTNRYTAIDASPLGYDAAGNLTQDKDDYLYTCDYENRITKIEKPDGPDTGSDPDPVAEFAYDTQGRRIRVYDAVAQTTTLYYYSDNWQVLSEYTPSGTQQAYYVFGNYIDEVLLMRRNGADYYYLHDHLYSPVALVNSSGAVVERYEYDAYGKVTVWNSDYSTSYNASQYGNPYTFTGRELDVLDNGSLKLMHYRHRTYNIYTGRFMQRDQLGINPSGAKENSFVVLRQYLDGVNTYEYGLSNPAKNADFYGTRPYEIACSPIADGDEWWRPILRKCEVPHCELPSAGLSAPGDDVYPVWRRAYGFVLDGRAEGTRCKCAKRGDIDDCIRAVKQRLPWGSIYPNCHTQTATIIESCCLKTTWKVPCCAGPTCTKYNGGIYF